VPFTQGGPAPTLAALLRQLAQGETTSVALTEAALQRARDPGGEGARTFIVLYEERALAEARASDALRRQGGTLGPLAGLPISIKDLFDVEGEVTRAGSRVLEDAAPATRDATIVTRLRNAGAILVGRTNMVEFAYSGLGLNPHFGTPLNPWERAIGRVPGGSSSGAAISVTDGMCAAAIGTDTGGSVRIPAALCGLTGFKPTARRVDATGTLPLSVSLDSIGPLANSVDCCARLDAVLSGAPRSEASVGATPPVRGLRLIVPTNVVQDDLDDAVAASFARALDALGRAGAVITVERVPEIDDWYQVRDRRSAIAAGEAFAWHRDLLGRAQSRYDPRVAKRLLTGAGATAADFVAWREDRLDWIATMQARLAAFDAMLLPTVACVAPRLAPLIADDARYSEANGRVLRNTRMINYLDGCALSLPCHRHGEAPVGLMVAANAMADQHVLEMGRAIEACLSQIRQ
jgi:aspartyl-tRNA(Asn)/glutamyl-tRNA(Gln) amidotransferase subunit A